METRRINLALQGGGAHGAFTWGVLDRLLQEDWLEIAAISGTSAGALNGAALKAGLARGGREGARENLAWLWSQVSEVNDLRLDRWVSALFPYPEAINRWIEAFTPAAWMDQLSRMISPYDSGPFYVNPLERIVERFEYDDVCAKEGPDFFVSATNVRTGKIRVFSGDEINADAILASACLPNLFRAIEMEDPQTGRTEAFWDGGFTGNPALFPLFEPQYPRDVLIVNINPLLREGVPRTPAEIEERVNEISFNSSLLRELRAIQFVRRLIADGRLSEGGMKDVLIHMIADDDVMTDLGAATKVTPTNGTLERLHGAGVAAAERFLSAHSGDLGQRASVDLEALFG
ncbi:patatin-like phospholipase family protein [Pseudothioclava nitratireducens]|uniref:patatin-like phospholipase family protein n=1 Tax=Pseudothioclava nitratireducens TaxID=1928646 RepID=UPI0023DA7197|nr:patatin-like phospholipase family protein [Defluviimonas nitratireducens]MDF1620643.1 patatin-like phospholipase family protein [Defluviimonas nitratireducens]